MTGSLERPLAAEKLLTGYNVAMALLWAVFITRVPHAPWLALAHAVAVPLPWMFARAMPTASRPFRFLRELNPLLFLGVFWLELDLVRPVLGLTGIDAPIAALDRLLTGGVHLHQVWLPAMHGRLFSEAMYFMYWAYYFAVYVPPIVLALMARYEPARDMVFRLVLVYLGCYVACSSRSLWTGRTSSSRRSRDRTRTGSSTGSWRARRGSATRAAARSPARTWPPR
jgi:hypothetical protein